MDTPALKFNTSKGKWKQGVFQDSAEQLQPQLFLSRPLRSLGVLLSTPTNMRVKADVSVDKGAECSGQSHRFFMNFQTVQWGVSQF